ncbi:MAG: hypothetical protein MUC99_02970 [Anaerolineae bacterium]|nr:hypothetical protein [Anaerolineae bacterium]
MDEQQLDAWVQRVRGRGWAKTVCALLDALEPLAPVAAQLLHVGQPVSRWVVRDFPATALADALETPEGVERLRARLRED